jgi:hypothetical protein
MANMESNANSKKQTANNKQQTANSKQQTANNKQQTANSKQQTVNSKQQTAKIGRPEGRPAEVAAVRAVHRSLRVRGERAW